MIVKFEPEKPGGGYSPSALKNELIQWFAAQGWKAEVEYVQFKIPRGKMILVPLSKLPECAFCSERGRYDANVPGVEKWGYLCPTHAKDHRITLGIGFGQVLWQSDEDPEEVWELYGNP